MASIIRPTQRHAYWGAFTTANLPNVSGSANETSVLAVGDTAYDTTTGGLKVCTTATAGAAVWASMGGAAATAIQSISSNTTVDITKSVIEVDTSGGARTLTLPALSAAWQGTIVKITSDANKIVLALADGTYAINQGGAGVSLDPLPTSDIATINVWGIHGNNSTKKYWVF